MIIAFKMPKAPLPWADRRQPRLELSLADWGHKKILRQHVQLGNVFASLRLADTDVASQQVILILAWDIRTHKVDKAQLRAAGSLHLLRCGQLFQR